MENGDLSNKKFAAWTRENCVLTMENDDLSNKNNDLTMEHGDLSKTHGDLTSKKQGNQAKYMGCQWDLTLRTWGSQLTKIEGKWWFLRAIEPIKMVV